MGKARQTPRKRLIAEVFESQFKSSAVLLDEFRWAVFRAERQLRNLVAETMPIVFKKSFNRTIAKHQKGLRIVFLGQAMDVDWKVLARAGLFRLKSGGAIREFLGDPSAKAAIALRSLKIFGPSRSRTRETRPILAIAFVSQAIDGRTERPVIGQVTFPMNGRIVCVASVAAGKIEPSRIHGVSAMSVT